MYKYLFSIFHYIGTIGSPIQDDYNQYSFYQKRPLSPRPLDAMADLTNDLGVCVLRVGMQHVLVLLRIENRDGSLAGPKLIIIKNIFSSIN